MSLGGEITPGGATRGAKMRAASVPATPPNVGTQIPPPSRSLVRPPVDERVSARAANPALSLAGADEPEPDPPEAVAADPAVVDAEGDTLYSNPVLHVTVHVTSSDAVYGNGKPITDEARRQSRLSRWQAQR